jgi:hypothetical protein
VDFEIIRFTTWTSGARASGKEERLETAMDNFEFSNASPILVAVKESRFTPIDRLITA